MISCPNCKDTILKAYPESKAKLRASIIIFKGNKSYAVCSRCKQETEIPITLNQEIPEVERLYIRK